MKENCLIFIYKHGVHVANMLTYSLRHTFQEKLSDEDILNQTKLCYLFLLPILVLRAVFGHLLFCMARLGTR